MIHQAEISLTSLRKSHRLQIPSWKCPRKQMWKVGHISDVKARLSVMLDRF